MATKELKHKAISPEIKAYIAETVYEALHDPDFGLELTEYAKKRLRAALKNSNKKGISLQEAREKYC
jgi:hypothetical protein